MFSGFPSRAIYPEEKCKALTCVSRFPVRTRACLPDEALADGAERAVDMRITANYYGDVSPPCVSGNVSQVYVILDNWLALAGLRSEFHLLEASASLEFKPATDSTDTNTTSHGISRFNTRGYARAQHAIPSVKPLDCPPS